MAALKLITGVNANRIYTNRAERSIKQFVIGRKNWLFSNTPRGAKTSAIIYSIIETAEENGLDPFTYLKCVLEQLQKSNSKIAIDDLLPWNLTVQSTLNIKLNPLHHNQEPKIFVGVRGCTLSEYPLCSCSER